MENKGWGCQRPRTSRMFIAHPLLKVCAKNFFNARSIPLSLTDKSRHRQTDPKTLVRATVWVIKYLVVQNRKKRNHATKTSTENKYNDTIICLKLLYDEVYGITKKDKPRTRQDDQFNYTSVFCDNRRIVCACMS